MNRRRNLLFIVVGLVLVIGIGIVAAGRPKNNAIEATLQTVSYTHFQTRLPETGVVQRPQTQTLTALVPGNIAQVFVKPGDRVAAGQLLVALSNPQLINAASGARAAYEAATGRASSAVQTNAVLPAQNQSSVVQAEYNLEQARSQLGQAITDQRNGAQSGLGYGGSTAESQRVAANAALSNADTNLREAQRIANADRDLYANKAISKDALDQQVARLDQARVADDQAKRQRDDTYTQLRQNRSVLGSRVQATRDAVRQAEAALTAARQQAAQNKSGDVVAARSDAQARLDDLNYANDQVTRLAIKAPYSGIVQTISAQSTDTLRQLQPGDTVTAGQPVVTIAANGSFVVRTRVDEQDISHVRIGQGAKVSGEDFGTQSLAGHVVNVGAVAQKSDDPSNTSRQVLTTVALDGSLPFLRDGMTVDVDIITNNFSHVIAIGNDAIRHDSTNKPFVYTVRKKDGHSVKTPIALGVANESQTIVKSGLALGDVIVVDRNPAIADGTAVKAAPSPSPKPSATGT